MNSILVNWVLMALILPLLVALVITQPRSVAFLANRFPSSSPVIGLDSVDRHRRPNREGHREAPDRSPRRGCRALTDGASAYRTLAKKHGNELRIVPRSVKYKTKGALHINNVNAYDQRLKGWMDRFNGVATRSISRTISAGTAGLTARSRKAPNASLPTRFPAN